MCRYDVVRNQYLGFLYHIYLGHQLIFVYIHHKLFLHHFRISISPWLTLLYIYYSLTENGNYTEPAEVIIVSADLIDLNNVLDNY